jgi:AraC-like DNA-binding protein
MCNNARMGAKRHLRPRPSLHPTLAIAGLAMMRVEPDPATPLDEHGHDVLELAWVERGALAHQLDGRPVEGPAGSLLVIPLGSVHRYDLMRAPVLLWNLLIDRERMAEQILPRPLDRHLPALLPVPGGDGLLLSDVDLAACCHGLWAEQSERAVGWPQAMAAQLRLLLIAAARALEAGRVQVLPRGHQRVETLRRRLDEAPERDWSLRTMAAEAGFGVPGLVRAFHRHCGRTPMAYLRQARLRRAQAILDGGATLTVAARTVGYASATALARARRLHTGILPLAEQGDDVLG